MDLVLRENLRYCICGNRVIFLDMASGRYSALPTKRFDAFRRWSLNMSSGVDAMDLDALKAQGILVENKGRMAGADMHQQLPDLPERYLETSGTHVDAYTFLGAMRDRIQWRWRIKHWDLARISQSMVELLDRYVIPTHQGRDLRFVEIVHAFAITDLFAGGHNRCLERSLALAGALRKNGFPCKVVLGVQANPFTAHCWLQDGPLIINEAPDKARLFTPIAAM